MSNRKLILFDGHALMYRAFYAIRGLSTKDGRPTNAVYGFIRAMHQMTQEATATHRTVVFDGGLPQERMELLPDYKAQRDPMPDDLRSQFEIVEEYLELAAIPCECLDGHEADDVLATLAEEGLAEGSDIVIVTSDKDLYQLIKPGLSILNPAKSREWMRSDEVIAKTGVTPKQIVDWLAMVGDSSDNIDGVPGVGKKTAAKLLNTHGSMHGIWKNIAEVKPERIQKALTEARPIVERNQDLIRLSDDLEVSLDWQSSEVKAADPDSVRSFYEKYELHSLIDQS